MLLTRARRAQHRVRVATTLLLSVVLSWVAVFYLVRPRSSGLTNTFNGVQISQLHPFTVIDHDNLRFFSLLSTPVNADLLMSFDDLTTTSQLADPIAFAQLVTNASTYLSSLDSTTAARYVADLDAAAVYSGTSSATPLRPVRCVGTAGSSLGWVNGFCVSYTERMIYHAWTANYFHNGEEARGGAMTNAVMFFVYNGAFLDRRLSETLVPDAVAVAGQGYFRVNHAWARTIDDPFSFQGIRNDGAAIVVVSFLSVLNFNGAKMLLGLQAPNPCFDVLEYIDHGYTNLVTSEYIWLGPQLATYIAQFVVVLVALGSVKSDISVSILVDLVAGTTYALVLLVFSLLGKYYLVFNLSSILTSDSLVSMSLISVISFYHNLIVSHVWPSKLFVAITPSVIRTGVVHRGLLTLLALTVTATEVCLGCTYNESVQIGTNPTPCVFGTGDCFNAINLPVVACVVGYPCLLTLYTVAITTYVRRQPRALFVAAKWMSFRQVELEIPPNHVPATTFETFCCDKRLDQLLQARYLCVDVPSGKIGTPSSQS